MRAPEGGVRISANANLPAWMGCPGFLLCLPACDFFPKSQVIQSGTAGGGADFCLLTVRAAWRGINSSSASSASFAVKGSQCLRPRNGVCMQTFINGATSSNTASMDSTRSRPVEALTSA